MIKNYGLFEKYLAKISSSTISKFGSIEDISNFLLYLCEYGNDTGLKNQDKKIIILFPIFAFFKLQFVHNFV